jgi:hypothetical protein
MSDLYGPKKRFSSRSAAEQFLRHVTRELTAGGIAHWVEAREEAPGRWLAFVHRSDCEGSAACRCGVARHS